jgi:hypothetical protein
MTPTELIFQLIETSMFLIAISITYKPHFLYELLDGIILGGSTGVILVSTALSFYKDTLTPLLRGDLINIFPVIWGITFFLIFVPRFMFWYRVTLGFYVITALVVTLQTQYNLSYLQLYNLSVFKNGWTDALLIIAMISTWSYFSFSRKLSGVTRRIGTLGPLFIMASFGGGIASHIFRGLGSTYPYVRNAVTTPALVLVVITVALIFIDIVYKGGLRSLLHLPVKEAQPIKG